VEKKEETKKRVVISQPRVEKEKKEERKVKVRNQPNPSLNSERDTPIENEC